MPASLVELESRGLAHLGTNPRGAADAFAEAVSLAPSRADLHHYLGMALWRLGDADAALLAYSTAASLVSDDPALHLGMAQLHEQLSQPRDAARDYRSVVTIAPRTGEAWAGLARLHARLGRPWRAAWARRKLRRLYGGG
jgi:Flp pilus assembly protein TadD